MRWTLAAAFAMAACGSDDPNQLAGTAASVKHRSADTPAVTADDTSASISAQCAQIINKYRAQLGLAPYKEWTSEESCSAGEAKSDATSGTDHGAFTQCGEFAQNECPGYPDPASDNLPECLADMWAEGKGGGHYDNMSSTEYSEVACGIYELSNGSFWAVQNFK